jgi:hypothetical protein
VAILAGIAAAVLALVLLVRVVDSTIDLLGFGPTPNPPIATIDSGSDDAESLDPVPVRTSSDARPIEPIPGDARPSAAPMPNRIDAARANPAESDVNQGTFVDADVSDSRAFDENDAAASQALAVARVMDASDGPAQQRAAVANPAATPASQAAPPVRCGWRTCPEGQQCCNWRCGTCVRPGETCSLYCGAPALPVSTPCGPNTCNVAEVCCNPSCGICVAPGGTCSKEPCPGMYLPVSPTCGMNTCNVGQVCCNPSCGICANPGETCSQAPCL